MVSWWSCKGILAFPELGGLVGGCFWKLCFINSIQFCLFWFFVHNFLRGRFVCLVGEEITIKELMAEINNLKTGATFLKRETPDLLILGQVEDT